MTEKKFILATRNSGKLREFNHAFEGSGIVFVGLDEISGAPDVEETGDTYEENALIKARAVATYTGKPVVADDSGIEIDAIPGELGVKSARWAGDRPYDEVNKVILDRLKEKRGEERAARYVAAIAYVDPATEWEKIVRATCEGVIHDKQEGEGGFGFDPIFFVPDQGVTMAQLTLDVKNKISHRAKAITKLKSIIYD